MSKALIKENLKQTWYLPVLSLVVYVIAAIIPFLIMVSGGEIHMAGRLIGYSLSNFSVPMALMLCVPPMISAGLMMNFLHSKNYSLAIHSQPFSRNKIFASNLFTGLALTIVPILVMGILFFIFKQDVTVTQMAGNSYGPDYGVNTNPYTSQAILLWLESTFCSAIFFYGTAILAGALTGTVFMQLVMSLVLTLTVPAILFMTTWYFEICFDSYGGMPDFVSKIMNNSNPLIHIITQGGIQNHKTNLFFLSIGIISMALALVAYRKVKLERVTDSFLFKAVDEAVTAIVSLIGGTIVGVFFAITTYNHMVMVAGLLIGSILAFVIIKIIVNKSIKIANLQTAKSLAASLILIIAFSAFTVFDITGYNDRIPAVDRVETVSWNGLDFYTMIKAGGNINEPDPKYEVVDDKENIEKVTQLHSYLTTLEPYDQAVEKLSSNEAGSAKYFSTTFIYRLSNGYLMERVFNVVLDDKIESMVEDLITTEEFQEDNNIFSYTNPSDVSSIEFTLNVYNPDVTKEEMDADDSKYYSLTLTGDAIADAFAAWSKDFQELTFNYNNFAVFNTADNKDMVFDCVINFADCKADSAHDSTSNFNYNNAITIDINPIYKHSYQFFMDYCKDNGEEEIAAYMEELL